MSTTTTLQSASDVSVSAINNMNINSMNMNNIDKSKSNKNDGLNTKSNIGITGNYSYPEPIPSMDKQLSSTQFWINDPLVLFKSEEVMDIWPAPLMSIEQKLNAISRIVILLTLLGFLITKNINILFTGAITLAIFVMMYKLQYQQEYDEKNGNDKKKEGFTNSAFFNKSTNNNLELSKYSKTYGPVMPNMTMPTVTNPMMNVLLPEIAYNPERNEAALAYDPKVEKEINHTTEVATVLDFEPRTLTEAEKLRKKLFADLGDKYEFDDSMRSFYTNPSTTIPNDQKAFAEFCYGSMISCKEGNEFACQRFNPVLGSVIN